VRIRVMRLRNVFSGRCCFPSRKKGGGNASASEALQNFPANAKKREKKKEGEKHVTSRYIGSGEKGFPKSSTYNSHKGEGREGREGKRKGKRRVIFFEGSRGRQKGGKKRKRPTPSPLWHLREGGKRPEQLRLIKRGGEENKARGVVSMPAMGVKERKRGVNLPTIKMDQIRRGEKMHPASP